ncbi:unnamed protein product [Allacma fusca]|uniref:Transmembrane protein n=1 Tax=Allacma fusca TaxID=39272 RepID=A0A8J2KFP4_9HEXA|nr:unnamed protein product [Allacma fusca]
MESGPLLDPYLAVNPCCCCCGEVSIGKGIKTVATISMTLGIGYGIMGMWFALKAFVSNTGENLPEILAICAVTSVVGGIIRFLSSFFLHRSVKNESKTTAKIWCALSFGLVIVVTAIILAVSQKNPIFFDSLSIKVFLCLCALDFLLLLYFLWVIIVFVKEIIDMPT